MTYYLGPMVADRTVQQFTNQLEAIQYLRDMLVGRIANNKGNVTKTKQEHARLSEAIQSLEASGKKDSDTSTLAIVGEDNSIELDCAGYWSEFVATSQQYWDQWACGFAEMRSGEIYWENRGNDSVTDMIENDPEMDYIEENLQYGNMPQDIDDPDFVYHLELIMPT